MNIESTEFGTLMQNIWEARTPEAYDKACQRLVHFTNAVLVSVQAQAVEAFKAQCRNEHLVLCDEYHLDTVLKAATIPREVQPAFEHIKTDQLNASTIGADGPEFTCKEDEDLDRLLNDTAMLLSGRASHDVGMMWMESLETVLARLAGNVPEDVLDLDVPDDESSADVDGRLIKLLADQVESNKFELLLGGMNFGALCDDGEPSLLVLTNSIEEEFDVQLEDISEDTLETLNQVIAQKLKGNGDTEPKKLSLSSQEVEELLLEVLADYLPSGIERPDMETPIGELWSDPDDQVDLIEDIEKEFGDIELNDTGILRKTIEQLVHHIWEIQQ